MRSLTLRKVYVSSLDLEYDYDEYMTGCVAGWLLGSGAGTGAECSHRRSPRTRGRPCAAVSSPTTRTPTSRPWTVCVTTCSTRSTRRSAATWTTPARRYCRKFLSINNQQTEEPYALSNGGYRIIVVTTCAPSHPKTWLPNCQPWDELR